MFGQKLQKLIDISIDNSYTDNFDVGRFGLPERSTVNSIEATEQIIKYLPQLEGFYGLLENQNSKDLLVLVAAFRILGHKKIKLPFSIPEREKLIEMIDKLLDKTNTFNTNFLGWELYLGKFNEIGIPITMYTRASAILTMFFLKQYEYQISDNEFIKAEEGDIVIDGGGCWGDTALFFALEVGETGKVFTFEFLPTNLKIMEENLSLNPDYFTRIEVVKNPLWEKSDLDMYYFENGPGTKVTFDKLKEYDGIVKSFSIDDLVERKNLQKVDFIKMDIESAEPFALKGAINTIKKYKPKMAISIYHTMSDFANIVHWINDLNLGYKFYLNHYTIHQEETVLYCKV